MPEAMKFVAKVFIGAVAAAAGATLIKNGINDAKNIPIKSGHNNENRYR